MAKASPAIESFNSGEFSPFLWGRLTYPYHKSACRKLRNFIPTPQGPARNRAGTRFVAEVKSSANRTWLYKFEFNVTQSYVLEFGNQYIRFFANHGVVGAPYEVTTPYTTADLISDAGTFNLRFVQSGDVLYIVHPKYAPRKLSRTGPASFTLSTVPFVGGPFKDIDVTNTTTVYCNASTGTGRTLTASSAIFTAAHIGSMFYLEQKPTSITPQWEAGKAIGIGNIRKSMGKNYQAINAATTGTVRPTHFNGVEYDGDTGVQWQFNDAGFGWCTITAIGGGGTTATVDILSRIPDGAVGAGNASTVWAFGAWSDSEGWPSSIAFFKDRLVLARNKYLWFSCAGDFENFSAKDYGGTVTAEQAIRGEVASDKANSIEWMVPSDLALLVGTVGDEFTVREMSTSEPFGPGNVDVKKQSEFGSARVPTVRVGNGMLFCQVSRRKIMDMTLSDSIEGRWDSADITIKASHVTKTGVSDLVYQQEPDSIIWTLTSDGRLSGVTLNRAQDVAGWHPHRIGGYSNQYDSEFAIVESVITIPSPDGNSDELWMIVNRYINGGTKRYVEFMETQHEEGDDPEDAFYVDSGLTLDNKINATLTVGVGSDVKGSVGVVFGAGAAVFSAGDVGKHIHYRYKTVDIAGKVVWKTSEAEITQYNSTVEVLCEIHYPWPRLMTIAANYWRKTASTISGLNHLIGQTVTILADGAVHANKVVNGSGTIVLDSQASKVHVGLPYTAVLQPMAIEAGSADGVAETKTKRISRCGIWFHETMGAKYGRDEQEQLDEIQMRSPDDEMDKAPPLFSGDVVVSWPDGYSDEGMITIVQDKPGPCMVVCLVPQIVTQDDR